jgi:selenide,water dikinase
VVRLDAERALVQTVDFFTPVVDDPYTFGAIAATNSLSDVYAMGGEPLTALNILCWDDTLDSEILHHILRGGLDKVREAGAILAGGHSVTDDEIKFGLSVTGLVHPDRIWRNQGARPGDRLVLTKPVGTGIVTTAMKRDDCPPELEKAAVAAMLLLNRGARDAGVKREVHACTDITGFGLAGHAWEMARASDVTLRFRAREVPILEGVVALAERGHLTRGEESNREYLGNALVWQDVPAGLQSVLVDPQTSGGLLFAVPPEDARALVRDGVGVEVGEVLAGPAKVVFAS